MFLKRKIKKELYNYRHRYQELDWIISYLERNRLEYGVLGGFCLSVLKNTTANDIDIIVDDEITEKPFTSIESFWSVHNGRQ